MRKRRKSMQECRECAELLEWASACIEGDATEELRRELMIHVSSCTACARLFRSLKRVVHFCQLETGCDVPGEVHERLWIAIRQELLSEDEE
ncbi:MAG: hypothetical protein ABIK44_02110 [candidate division WOR-3 bacterium]